MNRDYIYVNVNRLENGMCCLVIRPEFRTNKDDIHLNKAYKSACIQVDDYLRRNKYKPTVSNGIIYLNKPIVSEKRFFGYIKDIINKEFRFLDAYVVTANDKLR